MRILLAIHNAYTDPTSGAARSVRTILRWMSEAGHECRVLGTARFDAKPPTDITEHLASLDAPIEYIAPDKKTIKSGGQPLELSMGCPLAKFDFEGIPVEMLLTKHNQADQPDRLEGEQFLSCLEEAFNTFRPNLLFTYGPHPVIQEAMRRARLRSVTTLFTLRNHGYEDRRFFEFADHVLTCSLYLSETYRQKIGLLSAGIPSPIEWSEVLSGEDARAFITFVNPSLLKGAALFARLADMLGSRRPDIPVLVVQSAADAASLNSIPGIDFSKYPQIMAAPPVDSPSEFFELTRLLLVPSVFNEPFGRVAAESLINGVPPIVSERGALPQTVNGAGRVISLPAWLNERSVTLPSEAETQPWFRAVCELWDDAELYQHLSTKAKQTAEELYSEEKLRRQYSDYFDSLGEKKPLFEA